MEAATSQDISNMILPDLRLACRERGERGGHRRVARGAPHGCPTPGGGPTRGSSPRLAHIARPGVLRPRASRNGACLTPPPPLLSGINPAGSKTTLVERLLQAITERSVPPVMKKSSAEVDTFSTHKNNYARPEGQNVGNHITGEGGAGHRQHTTVAGEARGARRGRGTRRERRA